MRRSVGAVPDGQVSTTPTTSVGLSGRDRFLILVSIAFATILAWLYLLRVSRQMSAVTDYAKAMAAMGMSVDSAWTRADVFLNFAMWLVMMVGMMAPSAAPVLMVFTAAMRKRGGAAAAIVPAIFGTGYFVAWAGFSAIATCGQWVMHHAAMLSPAMAAASPKLGGFILIAAGVYQITPWKDQCLSHCRSPLGFLLSSWRDGPWGAARMGFHHGLYCLGCCWALMCVLFAVGIMNLLAVAALTILVLLEKVGPRGAIVARASGAGLVAYGAWMIFR